MSVENTVCMGCLVNPNWINSHLPEIPTIIKIDSRPAGSPTYAEMQKISEGPISDGLTSEEKEVLKNLAFAWDAYVKIEKKDSSIKEFNDAIHRCQQLIALRVARRVNPEVWVE
jgi:hypothetical protein